MNPEAENSKASDWNGHHAHWMEPQFNEKFGLSAIRVAYREPTTGTGRATPREREAESYRKVAMKFAGGDASSLRRQNDSTEHQIRWDWSRWIGGLLGWTGEAITADESAMSICDGRSKSILGRASDEAADCRVSERAPYWHVATAFCPARPLVLSFCAPPLAYPMSSWLTLRGLNWVVKVTEPLCIFYGFPNFPLGDNLQSPMTKSEATRDLLP